MNLSISGLPAIAVAIGFIVVFAAPVWLAARIVGADQPTLPRSVLALLLGLACTMASVEAAGVLAFVLAPLSFVLSFKWVLGNTMFGAVVLGVLAIAGYVVMVRVVAAAFSLAGLH